MSRNKYIQGALDLVYAGIAAWQLVARRSLAHWRLISYVLIGVVLASAILSGTVIYFDALRSLALKNTLAQRTAAELDIVQEITRGPTNAEDYQKVVTVVDAETNQHAAWMLRDRIMAGKSPTFFLAGEGNEAEASQGNMRALFLFMPDLGRFTTFRPNSLQPQDAAPTPPGQPFEVEALLPQKAAAALGVGVGDRMVAVPSFSSSAPHVIVTISGIFDYNMPVDNEFVHFQEQVLNPTRDTSNFLTAPFYITERSYIDAFGPSIVRLNTTYTWFLKTDTSLITADNADLTLANLRLMARDAASQLQAYSQTSRLETALTEYDRRVFFSKLPMFVVLILISLVILYYVATMSALLVETQKGEVALFRSRGSSGAQILTVFVLEGLGIAFLAVIVAPLMAAFVISLLGYTPIFADLTGGSLLAVRITGGAYALSVLGGVLSFMALLVPAVQASRFGLTQQRQMAARPNALPAFQRYYLDVLLLIVAVFLFRQLTEQGSVVVTNVLGRQTADELLLAVPGLVLVASAMVLLRLFPLGMNLISKLFSKWLPAAAAITVWQMSREPTHYARLSLLLILTAGLGIFASSFGATLERSFRERILYTTGSDVRLTNVNPDQGVTLTNTETRSAVSAAYESIDGVDSAAAVLRRPGRDLGKTEGGSFEMLAVEPSTFAENAWFREDFANESLGDLLSSIRHDSTAADPGIPIPDDATSIGARVRADRLQPTVRVVARLRNATGQEAAYPLGTLESNEWLDLQAPIVTEGRDAFLSAKPLALASLYVEESNIALRLRAGSLQIDEVWVGTSGSNRQVIENFDGISGWNTLQTLAASLSDTLRPASEVFSDQTGTAIFAWTQGEPLTARGVFYGEHPAALPVLASRGFLETEGYEIGDRLDAAVSNVRIPLHIVGEVSLFPTVMSETSKYLIADVLATGRYAATGISDRPFNAEEIWITTQTRGEERVQLLERLKKIDGFSTVQVLDREERFTARDATVDPLVDAGWRALLFIAFAAVLVLSCLGFLVHVYVSFRNRQVHFALLRTIGLSVGQLISLVWLEQTLVILLGMALGTWMGGRLGATIMPFLGHDDFGGRVIPPFVMEIEWGSLLATYAAMLVVFVVISVGLIVLIRRISLHRLLRIGEAG